MMNYTGTLYGKIGRRFIPLTLTSEDVDQMEKNLALCQSVKLQIQTHRDNLERERVRLVGELESAKQDAAQSLHERNEIRAKLESLPAELAMLRASNPSPDWKAAIDAVMNILPR